MGIANVVRHVAPIPVQSINIKATASLALPVWKRPIAGDLLDLKKYRADQASSAASDTEASRTSETEETHSDLISDAGESLSTIDTANETLSEKERTSIVKRVMWMRLRLHQLSCLSCLD